jgi:hypothetical protein
LARAVSDLGAPARDEAVSRLVSSPGVAERGLLGSIPDERGLQSPEGAIIGISYAPVLHD